jgi:phosphohistidine swiveling domain-containing protein
LTVSIVGRGVGFGTGRVRGRLRVLSSRTDFASIQDGDIVVLDRPESELVLWLSRLKGIVSRSGGRTSHLVLIARELGIPYLLMTELLQPLITGDAVVLDPSAGILLLDRDSNFG